MSPRSRGSVVVVLAVALLTPGRIAAQGGAIGRVKIASGTATILRAGQAIPAAAGTEVFESDTLRTGADGRLAVMLRDETRLALGPGSEVSVAAFAFTPAESRLGLTVRVARGVLSYVSGLVARLAPAAVSIQTPTSVIGVRGTHALVRVGAR